ncbi:MAG: glycosyltransferase family 39 protein [Chloroflexi bacterium]|nr:glycosyltransferase family 39 protein [Chloroflexota bacterium]
MFTPGRLLKLVRCEHSGIVLLVMILLTLHFAAIMQPGREIFDEQHYVSSARYILQGAGTDRVDHPPLGQLIITSGIKVFGDNPFGWRFFSVVFGVAGIVFFHFICRRLKMPTRYAYLATFLLSFENLSFIQSSVAMLDVFSLSFMLLSFWLYLRGHFTISGAMAGLAALAKLTGILVLPAILLHWIVTDRKHLRSMTALVAIVPVTFFLVMSLANPIIWHKWLNPFSQTATMLQINSASTFAKFPLEMVSRPWEWIIEPQIMTYWIDPHYLAMISPPVWALIVPAIGFAIFQAVAGNRAALFAVLWFAVAYLTWIPLNLLTDRTTYLYYFYPAIGSVCIALSLIAARLDEISGRLRPGARKKLYDTAVPFYLLLCLGAFVVLSPISWWWKFPLVSAAYLVSRYYTSSERQFNSQGI